MNKKWIRSLVFSLTLLGLTGSLILGSLYARGFWDEQRAVHIKAREIESSTLAIGSHLIHLSALNDGVYEIAQESVGESGQEQIFYKSELGGDAWFNISSASSLKDITVSGVPVRDEEMEALFFTHHTKSDQITYDLRTGQAVNLFDIKDPYALEALEELIPLKMYYDQMMEMQGENKVTKRIDKIWETPVSGEKGPAQIRELEKKLSGLQGYLQTLSQKQAPSREVEKVTAVMEAVDAARRYEVFVVLDPVLSDYLDELGKGGMVSVESGEDEEKKTVELMENEPELLSAVAESLGNVQDALIKNGGKMLSEGTTVMSDAEYLFTHSLIAHAESGSYSSCDTDVEKLLLLDNILNDVIADRPKELKLLEGKLIAEGSSAYVQALGQGESAEYRAERAKQAPEAICNGLISKNEGEVNSRRGELEFLIEAKCKRIDPESGMKFIQQRLNQANGYPAAVPRDDFAEKSIVSVDRHIEFLSKKFRQLELATGGNEMDQLLAEKEELQTKRLSALDKNDLAGAKKQEKELAALEEKIRTMEAQSAAEIGKVNEKLRELEKQIAENPESSELKAQLSEEKAKLSQMEKSISDGSLSAMVTKLKGDALDGLSDGGPETEKTLAQAVDALSALLTTEPKLVLPAMQEIYHQLLLNGGDQALVDTIEQAILDHPNALREELSAAELKEIAREFRREKGSDTLTDEGSTGSPSGELPGTDTQGGSDGEGTESSGSQGGEGGGKDEADAGSHGGDSAGKTELLGTGGISRTRARDALVEVAALQLYADETGSRAAARRLGAVAQEQRNLGNPLVFRRIQDGVEEYVPLSAIQALTGRRYVWNKNASLGVLAWGSDYYGFTVYSAKVFRDRDRVKTEEMAQCARYQAGIHIPEEYAYEQFGIQAMYITGTELGCACDDALLEMAQELFARFLAA